MCVIMFTCQRSEVRGQRSEVRGQRSEVADYAQNSYFLFVHLSFTKVLPTVQCENTLYDEKIQMITRNMYHFA